MSKKKPRRIGYFPTHIDKYPYVTIKNTSKELERVEIVIFPEKGKSGHGISIPRSLARLTARRINQFLDFTMKK
jgi:hypothetical protein